MNPDHWPAVPHIVHASRTLLTVWLHILFPMRLRMEWTKAFCTVITSKWDTHHISPWFGGRDGLQNAVHQLRIVMAHRPRVLHCWVISPLFLGIWPVIRLIAWKEICLRVCHYCMIFSFATTPYGLYHKMLSMVYLPSSCCKS
jgi:hypothetical protein